MSGWTESAWLRTRETVIGDTCAAVATSRTVTAAGLRRAHIVRHSLEYKLFSCQSLYTKYCGTVNNQTRMQVRHDDGYTGLFSQKTMNAMLAEGLHHHAISSGVTDKGLDFGEWDKGDWPIPIEFT